MRTKKSKRYDEQIDIEIKKVVSKFSEHLMSNSKWVRLIDKLVAEIGIVKRIKFKRIQDGKIGELHLEEDTTFGFDYWQNGFEGLNSLGGWLTFKEIEYLVFPRIIDEAKNTEQDLNAIRKTIERIGQFSLAIDEDEIKLICYRK